MYQNLQQLSLQNLHSKTAQSLKGGMSEIQQLTNLKIQVYKFQI